MTMMVRSVWLRRDSQRVAERGLGIGIQRARGLVKDEDGRLAHQRAGDIQTLALPAGQPVAPVAEQTIEAARQRFDEIQRAGEPRGLPHFVVRRIVLAVADVLGGGNIEYLRLLWNEGDTSA